ncbi:uncharacterized protein LOC130808204 [Amaranthus tricolor]|uniref:uncharacterized protein LOC130808204 n=1 Tax=Amaranthus tricolor TaxID=29722 RepID=UPI00258D7C27|nr:uncharacterized protein LOC130808204 [Amaranthus tricolor]
MSGVSLTVAPGSGPDTTSTPSSDLREKLFHRNNRQPKSPMGVMGSLRVIELQLVAFIMVFSVSGLVPLSDIIFPAFVSTYIIGLSRFAFPSYSSLSSHSREIFQGSRLFRSYVILGTIVGLFLPLAYVLGGFARGDNHAVRSATPPLFLLSSQILTENIISGLSLFSPPVRAVVPLLYTGQRIFVIVEWMQDVWLRKTLHVNASVQDVAWYWFGRILAVGNLLYFSINLFCFLIPRFLPRAFERYFSERDETHRKTSEDKNSSTAANTSQTSSKKSD